MVKNINKFIETDEEYLQSCFFTPKNLTEEDKKRLKILKKQADKIRKEFKNIQATNK